MAGKRLQAIAAHIPRCRTLADVGCDHGLLGEYALANGLCERVVFSDVSAPSLEKAKRRCQRFGDAALFFVSDGFRSYPYLPDAALICGMGGKETIKILRENPGVCELVLQPMRDVAAVREFLSDSGYEIETDEVTSERRQFYFILTASLTGRKGCLSSRELSFGKTNLSAFGRDFRQYLNVEIERSRLLLAEETLPETKKQELSGYIREIEELFHERTRSR